MFNEEFNVMNNLCQKVVAGAAATVALSFTLMGAESASAQSTTTCQSFNRQRVNCAIDTRDGVEIETQLSQESCRGKWGFRRGYVWVEDGCRATFRSLGDQNQYGRGDRDDRYERDTSYYQRDSGDYYNDLNRIYQDVLNRDIDHNGYRIYSNHLKNGWSVARVREDVARSREAADAINRLYQEVLGRDADRDGLLMYQRRLEDGWTLRRVRRDIASSREAQQRRR